MNPEFWLDKWKHNDTKFHQQEFNRYLTQYWEKLQVAPNSQVLVPLCGKSLDMLWLRQQGYHVIGVEISELAASQFFAENRLSANITHWDEFNQYETENITLWQGDFFKLKPNHADQITAVFDRAALVALPPQMRQRYACHLLSLLPERARIMLITFEYGQNDMEGPPFAVPEAEVEQLYGSQFDIVLALTQDVLAQYPAFQAAGLNYLIEKIYLLTPRQ